MRKNLTKKLFLSVLTLAFAVISLGASTYAWFTLSKNAEVEAFSGTVQSGTSGLEIGVGLPNADEPVQWRATSLDIMEDLKNDIDFVNFRFDAVQNADPLGSGKFTNLDGSDAYANNPTDTGVKAKYFSFRIFFRLADSNTSGETSADVVLTNYGMFTNAVKDDNDELQNGTVNGWFVNKEYTLIDNQTKVNNQNVFYYVSDAARLSVKGGINDLLLETHAFANTEANYKSSGKQQNGALSYYNAINEDAPQTLPTTYADPIPSGTYTNDKIVCHLEKDATGFVLGYIDINVWIDGWDGECINAIFGQKLYVTLSFALAAQTENN